jgi:hypothetical protein
MEVTTIRREIRIGDEDDMLMAEADAIMHRNDAQDATSGQGEQEDVFA